MAGPNQTVAADREKYFADTITKLEDRAGDTLKNAYQLLNMYIVFQGVIIAAVSQQSSSSSSKCGHWPYFLTFSVMAFFIYGLPLAYTGSILVQDWKLLETCILLQVEGEGGIEGMIQELKKYKKRNALRDWSLWRYFIVATVIVLLLLGFNVFVAYASRVMLCGKKHV